MLASSAVKRRFCASRRCARPGKMPRYNSRFLQSLGVRGNVCFDHLLGLYISLQRDYAPRRPRLG